MPSLEIVEVISRMLAMVISALMMVISVLAMVISMLEMTFRGLGLRSMKPSLTPYYIYNINE